MKVFLIILGVILLLFILILSISAELTVIFDNGWTTKIKVLFIEKDIELTKLLSFLVAPEKAGKDAAEKAKSKKKKGKDDGGQDTVSDDKDDVQSDKVDIEEEKTEKKHEITEAETDADVDSQTPEKGKTEKEKPKKKNPIMKILDEDGVVGLLLLVSNLLQTVNTAATTLIKGLHIYSLYVKMIICGGDAATIAEKYGSICGWYYPLKGVILNQMKVDNYDDYIVPDFIAPRSEYEFQFIGSISVGLLFKVGLKAGATFIVNFIKNR